MIDAAVLDRLATLVAEASGLQMRATNRWLLAARVETRMRVLGTEDPRAYLECVEGEGGAGELGALIESIRVGETRFFRHGAQLLALRRLVIPEIRARAEAGDRRVRAWSAGCSTGEEPYTLAMLLDEAMPRSRRFEVSVLATDLSEEALAKAETGRYDADSVRPVPSLLRGRYFVQEGDAFRVASSLRALVRFERRNLLDRAYPRGFDLVLCRNVLIYFGPLGRDEVIRRLATSLDPGGFLFLGYSEALRVFEAGFEVISTEAGTLYRKPLEGAPAAPVGPAPVRPPVPEPGSAPVRPPVPEPAPQPPARIVVLETQGSYDESDPRRLARELAPLLGRSARTVAVDLDGASFLDDGVARDLRRARAVLASEGRRLVLHADRPGVRRWLDRVGLRDEIPVVARDERA